jgi:uncharacterized protein YndB with AHSA1/START domain
MSEDVTFARVIDAAPEVVFDAFATAAASTRSAPTGAYARCRSRRCAA